MRNEIGKALVAPFGHLDSCGHHLQQPGAAWRNDLAPDVKTKGPLLMISDRSNPGTLATTLPPTASLYSPWGNLTTRPLCDADHCTASRTLVANFSASTSTATSA